MNQGQDQIIIIIIHVDCNINNSSNTMPIKPRWQYQMFVLREWDSVWLIRSSCGRLALVSE